MGAQRAACSLEIRPSYVPRPRLYPSQVRFDRSQEDPHFVAWPAAAPSTAEESRGFPFIFGAGERELSFNSVRFPGIRPAFLFFPFFQ